MRILALDLGTKTGWAVRDHNWEIRSGTWQLITEKERKAQSKTGEDRAHDLRFLSLQQKIREFCPIDHIYFEDVEFSTYTYQTQLWAGLRTVVSLFYPGQVSFIHAIPVGTLKKFATGRGNANKKAMAVAYFQKHPNEAITNQPFKDDNEIDALHLLDYALWQMKLQTPQ